MLKKRDRRRAPAGAAHGDEIELEHAPVDVVVDGRDQALDLGRGHEVGDQVSGELDLGRLDLTQSLEGALVGQPLDLLDQARIGGRERVVQVEHAGERARRIDHRHVAQAMPAHHPDRLVEWLVDGDRGDRPGHQRADRLVGDSPSGDPPGHVLLGQNPGEALLAVQDDRRGGRRLHH